MVHRLGRLTFFSVAAILLLTSSCTKNQSPPVDAERVKNEAIAALNAYFDVIQAGDYDIAASMYDDDADFHWIDRGVLQYASAADAESSLKSLDQPGFRSVMTVKETHAADLSNTSALVSVRYHFDQQTESGDPVFGFEGWMTVGMVKRNEGWKIAAGQAGPAAGESESASR